MRRAAASLDLGGSGQAVLFARKACNIPQGAPADFVRSALVASFTLAVSWQSPPNCANTSEELAGWLSATLKIAREERKVFHNHCQFLASLLMQPQHSQMAI